MTYTSALRGLFMWRLSKAQGFEIRIRDDEEMESSEVIKIKVN